MEMWRDGEMAVMVAVAAVNGKNKKTTSERLLVL